MPARDAPGVLSHQLSYPFHYSLGLHFPFVAFPQLFWQFPLGSNKVRSIIAEHILGFSLPCDESVQATNKGIHIKGVHVGS